MKQRPEFMNFAVDHMTLLLHPDLYKVAYPVFRIIFGVGLDDLLYEKRMKQPDGSEVSMTFANRIGKWASSDRSKELHTVVAVVQPSEHPSQPSHVRSMLGEKASHWQHIALRTPDLISFHKHATERGVQWVTPILKDEHENLIQTFSGEWYLPGGKPTGLFFEFLQRDPSTKEVEEIQKANKQTWFRDETFLGLYNEKEREYQSGKVKPFISEELFGAIIQYIGAKAMWELTETDITNIEGIMLEMTRKANA